MENVIYRGKTSLDELVYGPTVTREYSVTIADGAFRDIIDEDGRCHVVYADTVELKIIGKSEWIKLPSEYTEHRERVYRKYYATNEEWFCQLPIEEKAKWLNQQLMYATAAREQGYFTVDGLIKWLKEKHE